MPASLILSVALHLAVLVVAVVGLPHLARDAAAPPNIIPVQVVTVGERTTAPPPAEEVQPKEVAESPAEPEAPEAKETAAAEPAEAAFESPPPSPPPMPAEAAEQVAPPEPPPPPVPPERDLAALAPPVPPVPSEPETAVSPPEPVKVQPAPEPKPEKPEPSKEAVVPQPATSTTSTRSKPPKPPPLPKAKPDRPEPVQAEPKPETPKPEQPKREVAKKTEPKREVAKKTEPKRDEFAALESLVETMKKSSPVAEKPEKRPAKPPQDELASISSALQPASSRSITSSNLTISEIDALRRQLEGCWIVPVGAKDAEDLSVEIRVRLDQHGMVKSADIVDGARMARDPFFRAAAESAQRAVYKCSPLKVPKDKYSEWQDMTLTFDPKDFVS